MKKNTFAAVWNRFLHWKGWTSWLHWKGWKAIARWKLWGNIARWPGWKALLWPHPVIIALMTILSTAALIWVFAYHQETNPLAYLFYCCAFYALLTVCLRIPSAVKWCRQAAASSPWLQKYAAGSENRFRARLYRDQFISFLYGLFKILYGYFSASFWIAADGGYHLLQGILQLAVILRRRNHPGADIQWKTYRLCGMLILIMSVPIAGMVWLAVSTGAHKEYPGFLIFITALFAFYKLPSAFVRVAKDRRHTAPLDSAIRLLKLSQALFAMFSLQVSMIFQFGGSSDFAVLMNSLTGTAVWTMISGMGIYMLRRGHRDLNQYLQENCHE
ncbi:MAG: hypothetical protein IJE81_07050 [Oscillospiraceae bacterium]|nr:hypothetical protein [Oscillospiraceae bacterium]